MSRASLSRRLSLPGRHGGPGPGNLNRVAAARGHRELETRESTRRTWIPRRTGSRPRGHFRAYFCAASQAPTAGPAVADSDSDGGH